MNHEQITLYSKKGIFVFSKDPKNEKEIDLDEIQKMINRKGLMKHNKDVYFENPD